MPLPLPSFRFVSTINKMNDLIVVCVQLSLSLTLTPTHSYLLCAFALFFSIFSSAYREPFILALCVAYLRTLFFFLPNIHFIREALALLQFSFKICSFWSLVSNHSSCILLRYISFLLHSFLPVLNYFTYETIYDREQYWLYTKVSRMCSLAHW